MNLYKKLILLTFVVISYTHPFNNQAFSANLLVHETNIYSTSKTAILISTSKTDKTNDENKKIEG